MQDEGKGKENEEDVKKNRMGMHDTHNLKLSASQKISRDTARTHEKISFCGANPTKNSVKIAKKGSKLKFLCPLKILRFHQQRMRFHFGRVLRESMGGGRRVRERMRKM